MPFGLVERGCTAEELSVCHADLNWVGTLLAAFCAVGDDDGGDGGDGATGV